MSPPSSTTAPKIPRATPRPRPSSSPSRRSPTAKFTWAAQLKDQRLRPAQRCSSPPRLPLISPAGKSFTGSISVTITDTTPNATIFYTTDGTTPTAASTAYTGAITVTNTETITAIATATGFVSSQPASQTYTNGSQALAPTFNPPAGAYVSAQTVTLSDASPDSKIYYTLDGTTPTPGSRHDETLFRPTRRHPDHHDHARSPPRPASPTVPSPPRSTPSGQASPLVSRQPPSLMTFNGSTGLDDTRLQLTDGGQNEAGSAFFNVAAEHPELHNRLHLPALKPRRRRHDLHDSERRPKALGPNGGGLGYGPMRPAARAAFPRASRSSSISSPTREREPIRPVSIPTAHRRPFPPSTSRHLESICTAAAPSARTSFTTAPI